jgi:putative spermidine/putrescine transport system permease protein
MGQRRPPAGQREELIVMSTTAVGLLDDASRAGGIGRRWRPTSASSLLLAPAVVIVCFCLLVPLSYVVILSFNPPVSGEVELTADLTLANYARLFLQWFYTGILLRTISISAITTALCAVFGMVLALAIWRAPPRRRGLLVIIVISPLLVSIVTRTYGWMVVLGDAGILNTLLRAIGLVDAPLHMMFTQGAVVVGLVHVFLPLMVLSILAAIDKIDPALAQAAQTLGASSFVTFWQITFPLLIPGLTAGVTIVFSLAMSSYVTPALMGGRNSGMLTTLIYQQFVVTFNWHFGAALVVVLLATSLLALALVLLESGRRTRAWLVKP